MSIELFHADLPFTGPISVGSPAAEPSSDRRDEAALDYFPALLDVKQRPCLVVGGDEMAARKAELLLRAGARVTIVVARPDSAVEALADRGEATLVRRGFVAGDVSGKALVIGVAEAPELGERIAEAARERGVPVNIADRPELSSFIIPAIVDRNPVIVAISSGDASPILARLVRGWIEGLLPWRLGRLARLAGRFRRAVAAAVPGSASRRRFCERFLDGPLAERILAGEQPGRARRC